MLDVYNRYSKSLRFSPGSPVSPTRNVDRMVLD